MQKSLNLQIDRHTRRADEQREKPRLKISGRGVLSVDPTEVILSRAGRKEMEAIRRLKLKGMPLPRG